jgi:hypothetical protein
MEKSMEHAGEGEALFAGASLLSKTRDEAHGRDEGRRLKVINLFGAPGQGKSATAGGLFWLMKAKGMSVEQVSEYAKYLVLTGRVWQLESEQLYLFAKQHHKQHILRGKYEFCVSDSPLLLASFYAPDLTTPPTFHGMAAEYNDSFENLNFFLSRELADCEFEETGRLHSKEDSLRIEESMREFMLKKGLKWTEIAIDHKTPWTILEHIEAMEPGRVPRQGPGAPELVV